MFYLQFNAVFKSQMTFTRPATNRQLTFAEIAEETRLPESEVELLVMKALSLGLVKGSIDQVQQNVHMTWVQPRVLDRQQVQVLFIHMDQYMHTLKIYMNLRIDSRISIQIGIMQKKLDNWSTDVREMEKLVESEAREILT